MAEILIGIVCAVIIATVTVGGWWWYTYGRHCEGIGGRPVHYPWCKHERQPDA